MALRATLDLRASATPQGRVGGQAAAVAERHGVRVLHYERDFEIIAEVTGQAVEWSYPAVQPTRRLAQGRRIHWPKMASGVHGSPECRGKKSAARMNSAFASV